MAADDKKQQQQQEQANDHNGVKKAQKKAASQPLLGALMISMIMFSAINSCFMIVVPVLPLVVCTHSGIRSFYRGVIRFVESLWLWLAGGVIDIVGGTKVIIEGDWPVHAERAMVISNHRCRIDWMFLWVFMVRFGLSDSFRVILREDIKSFPCIGWVMQCCMFMFIRRGTQNRERDLGVIRDTCAYLAKRKEPNSLVLFPEGTDLSDSNLVKNNAYADKMGLPHTQHTLHPRGLAFITALNSSRGYLECLYDMTIAYIDYSPGERPSELSLVKGRMPKEVHILLKRIPIEKMPSEPEALEQFLKQSFAEKEKTLAYFQEHESFPKIDTGNTQPNDEDRRRLQQQSEWVSLKSFVVACFIYLCMSVLGVWLLATNNLYRIYVVLSTIMWYVITKYAGGFNAIELARPA